MGYLIQNLNCNTYTNRLNIRINATWLLRNYFSVYMTTLWGLNSDYLISTGFKNWMFWITIGKHFFGRLPQIICFSAKNLEQVTFGINFPKSAHFVGCSRIHNLLTQNSARLIPWLHTHFLYNTHIAIVTTPRVRKRLKCTLYQVLNYWLYIWVQLPSSFTLPHSFLCIPVSWKLIPFSNVFYFKVYNT